MKYLFTTLAVGDDYLNNSIECYKNIGSKTNLCDFNITTNVIFPNDGKINFDFFQMDRYHGNMPGFSFYLSLKSLSLKYAINKDYDYVIFNDADWRITQNFSEEKILSLFEYMEKNDLDFLFERPAEIGYHKNNPDICFFSEKINDFNVKEHTLWDKAHCTNEQFLVFKVNWKFKLFVMKWEQFLWYSIANNLRSYPDGFDIGVSALESNMNWDFNNWRFLVEKCFEFKDKQGNTHIRF
jgi:hypothetical protein